jgi:excisionase family DNA binding protein
MDSIPPLLTVPEVARLLRRKPWSVYQDAKRGKIPAYKMGRSVRFRREDIASFIENCRIKPPNVGGRQ